MGLLNKPGVSMEDIRSFAHKTFKTNPLLCDEFLGLLPSSQSPPAEVLLSNIAPEHVDLDDDDMNGEDELSRQNHRPGFEHMELPLSEEERGYGTEKCCCSCHVGPVAPHCLHCSIKFINGKVYAKDGKALKQVVVQYPDGSTLDSRLDSCRTKVKAKRKRLKSSTS